MYASKPLTLKIKENDLFIYHNLEEIASHKVELRKGVIIKKEEHFNGIAKNRNLYQKNIILTKSDFNKKLNTEVEVRELKNYDKFIGGNLWVS